MNVLFVLKEYCFAKLLWVTGWFYLPLEEKNTRRATMEDKKRARFRGMEGNVIIKISIYLIILDITIF